MTDDDLEKEHRKGNSTVYNRIKKLAAQIADLRLREEELKFSITTDQQQVRVKCKSDSYGDGCQKWSRITELVYIQTHWYERPHGCMGGDQWHEGEGQFVCKHCGKRNRLYNRKYITDLKRFFREVKEEHNG